VRTPCGKDAPLFAVKGRVGEKVSFLGLMEHKNKDEMGKSIDVVQPRLKIFEHFNFSEDILKSVRVAVFLTGDILSALKG
jgi:hypothetical protein